jgi:hypothetical protein
MPIWPRVATWRARERAAAAAPGSIRLDGPFAFAEVGALAVVFVLAAAKLSASTYNPFIYFRF